MKNIKITESSTGRHVVTIPVSVGALNYRPQDQEFFDDAWKAAVDDGLVDDLKRGEFVIEFAGSS